MFPVFQWETSPSKSNLNNKITLFFNTRLMYELSYVELCDFSNIDRKLFYRYKVIEFHIFVSGTQN
ncbi:hypothetical protein BpHYR1_030131 [Brachionus plicatilis]|uniref:Uncharacterized protein n=1 Tax=Brachionus plicatilis TaxID=10195 RepID=A0A3M7RMN3_BRAPC|nr:hypothetical protein BpHYR1_030131 [Brachionus plicatilis]